MWVIAGGCNALELKGHSLTLGQAVILYPEPRSWTGREMPLGG